MSEWLSSKTIGLTNQGSQYHIINNGRLFGCPIIYKNTKSQWYFIHRHVNNAWHSNANSPTREPYLTIIPSNWFHYGHLFAAVILLISLRRKTFDANIVNCVVGEKLECVWVQFFLQSKSASVVNKKLKSCKKGSSTAPTNNQNKWSN